MANAGIRTHAKTNPTALEPSDKTCATQNVPDIWLQNSEVSEEDFSEGLPQMLPQKSEENFSEDLPEICRPKPARDFITWNNLKNFNFGQLWGTFRWMILPTTPPKTHTQF